MTSTNLNNATGYIVSNINYTAKATLYNNIKFRSKTEAKFAYLCDILGIPYKYEPIRYELDLVHLEAEEIPLNIKDYLKHGYLHHIVDFELYNVLVDIKGPEPTPIEEIQFRIVSTKYPLILIRGGLPLTSALKKQEETKDQSILYTRDLNGQKKYPNMFLSECEHCGEVAFIHTCNCFHITYRSNLWATKRLIDAYHAAYSYPFEEIIGEIPFLNIPEVRI